ncbi:hypothetical protein HAX54_046109 [Datura stramonium]|uniref:Uncharacterized protein n=1 Tax=Datura stramonium TaxID=4076 RepID=A0ABS8WIJ9_DATST|nr:hypothetical protein [Datura stramonium]
MLSQPQHSHFVVPLCHDKQTSVVNFPASVSPPSTAVVYDQRPSDTVTSSLINPADINKNRGVYQYGHQFFQQLGDGKVSEKYTLWALQLMIFPLEIGLFILLIFLGHGRPML